MAIRLDQWIADNGYAPSRSRARDLVRQGLVFVNAERVTKPARGVGADDTIDVDTHAATRVSRAAVKLEAALHCFSRDPKDAVSLDVGASTGGFTQVLLEHGAQHVHAVDVGRDQLHPDLRDDPRVTSHEQTDARAITKDLLGGQVDVLVADLSFISQRTALAPVMRCVRRGGWMVTLVKPQFEVGPDGVGRGGIVRTPRLAEQALDDVVAWVGAQHGWTVAATMDSPITGGDGNREFLIAADRIHEGCDV